MKTASTIRKRAVDPRSGRWSGCTTQWFAAAMLMLAIVAAAPFRAAVAGTPVQLYNSFAGNINYTGTGRSLRTASNTVGPCTVVTSGSVALSGIPSGATVLAAYLYWAGSYSTVAGSTRTTPDYDVTFEGQAITAGRTFTERFVYSTTNYDFFSGFANVTAAVAAKGNGTYTLSGLNVNTGTPHCSSQTVLSGWTLVVVYEQSSEDFRVINVYDGFEYYYGSRIILTPSNFHIPASPINGKQSHITWEGDLENSGSLNGYSESLLFNGTTLSDAYNPSTNQYNSTINFLGTATSYGLDFDTYDISSLLSAGQTSATSTYQSGADMVILNAEVISVTNTPTADLAVTKSHTGNFPVGQQGQFIIAVSNNGPNTNPGPITVTDTMPTDFQYVSSTGSGWTVNASQAPNFTWTHPGPLAAGQSLPSITVTVDVQQDASPSVVNTATVSSQTFDNVSGNNSSSDTIACVYPNLSTSTKTVEDLNGGSVLPGDNLRYTINLKETGHYNATNVTVTDNIPANVAAFTVVSIPAGASNASTGAGTGANGNGYLNITGVTVPADSIWTIVFTVQVSGAAQPGDSIANTATIVNPGWTGATPSAPTLTVSTQPSSGNKLLYLDTLSTSPKLTRVQPASQTTVTIAGAGGIVNINLSPPTQAPLTIGAGSISIPIWIARNTTTGTRSATARLLYSGGSSGTIGSNSQSFNIPSSGTANAQLITFTIPLAGNLTLSAGTTLTLRITNTSNSSTRQIIPVSTLTGTYSRIILNALTVINVNTVSFYDAAYPGGNTISTVETGVQFLVRTVVSDPFGSADITGAAVTIRNPADTAIVTGAAMTLVNNSGTATKTYEYAYTIPGGSATGSWKAEVAAAEGTEGTISHTGIGTLNVVVFPSLETSTKTVVDLNGGDANPGDILRYTIYLNETNGADATNVTVTDNVPMHVMAFTVTSIPAGATNNSTYSGTGTNGTGYLNITGITVPANGSAAIEFTVLVAGNAHPGDTIANIATVVNPNGPGATPAAPGIVVSQSQITQSGNKYVYLNNLGTTPVLTRTPPSSQTVMSLTFSGDTRVIPLSPAIQTTTTIPAGSIPVTLWIDGGLFRSMTVQIGYSGSSNGIIGSDTQTLIISDGLLQATFTIDSAASHALAAGTTLNLSVTSNSSGTTNVYSTNTGTHSSINLSVNPAINIDSVTWYDAAYPGGAPVSVVQPGDSVYVRTMVSDPFGSYDIASASLGITNPNDTAVVTGAAMTMVNDSGAAEKTYQYAYTIPVDAVIGNWNATVTAVEGTEGIVTDSGVGGIQVASSAVSSLATSTKTVEDLNGGDADPGDILRYTIELMENGGADATGVIVTDDIPPHVTGFSVTTVPSGAANNSTGAGTGASSTGYLNLSNITVPADSTVTITFTVTVAGSAVPGDIIANYAVVINPNGPGAVPAAPNVVVSQSQLPTTGNKLLYLDSLNDQPALTRVPPAAQTVLTFTSSGQSGVIPLNPVLQAPLTVAAGPILVSLWIDGGFSRTVTAGLGYSGASNGTIGSNQQSLTILGGAQLATFTINAASDHTLTAGTALNLTITANSTGTTNIYSTNAGINSKVSIAVHPVVNVDSLTFRTAAYPGGTAVTFERPYGTVYIRAVVSDPFGSADISGAELEFRDAFNTVQVPLTNMSVVATGAATKTFEYPWTFPAGAAVGGWNATTTAREGTEGTVTDMSVATIDLRIPDIIMLKSTQTINDPVSAGDNPKAIPGAEVIYHILATNQGRGFADNGSVVVADAIPDNVSLFVGDMGGPGSGPVVFIDGPVTSGLTYTFSGLSSTTDCVEFSNDSGATWIYVPTPGPDGCDAAVTNIRVIPQGEFAGSNGMQHPSFEIRYKIKIE